MRRCCGNAWWTPDPEDDPESGPPEEFIAEMEASALLSEAEAALPDDLAVRFEAYLAAVDEREAQLAALIE